ncbi:MAG: UDP-N-acetylenolpyruvoylglucosamine reductase [Ignavibacteriales bacterium CG07_land_8_20_14_0_80_59_12]|nr:MAG: UDP-N-acetylenolpyruvoylglucosamine reductase [Ignavibacteriales bacterium CG07_land_8_20_14_0_80_59_12]
MVSLEEIGGFFRGRVLLSEPLKGYTTFRIGGPVDVYLEPRDAEDTVRIVAYLRANGFPFVIIGNGSNLLVSDEGFRGAAINLEAGLESVTIDGEKVSADAGVRVTKLVDDCIQQGLGGLEMLAGIPGTVGGAVMMNAGAYGGTVSDYLVDVAAIKDGELQTLVKEECRFGYRTSGLSGMVIVRALFNLPRRDRGELLRIRRELLLRRNETQPINYPNAGSIFKNPPGMRAATLIEDAGMKGVQAGGAEVSERHSNFIINRGTATAADIIQLIKQVRERVKARSGVTLELEVRLLGFREDILEGEEVR